MIRVLVVDDSPTARALLVEILRADPDIQVVGEAKDGLEGVELTAKLRPTLVTMDVRMPRLDGFAATKEIMIASPTPIVIVTASFDTREVEIAMQSLRAGALAVLRKPPGPESPAFEDAARKLVSTVKAMAQVKVVRHWRPAGRAKDEGQRTKEDDGSTSLRASSLAVRPCRKVVAVATSTGGPAALYRLLAGLPGDFAAPMLVVQHNAPGFMAGLVSWLGDSCDLRVKVAEQGEPLLPRTVYLAPDERHLGVSNQATVLLSPAPPICGFRPSGTYLFESAARAYGPALVALILTGMGDDGVEGLRAVRQAGGQVIAQDEGSSVVWGMPGAAVAAGLADSVLPLDAISIRLAELVTKG
jgi:two-component system chemotaxis response regulator CheB